MVQLSSMWQVRLMQRHCLSSRFQKGPWIGNTHRSVSCKFSKSYGPVRYAPRTTNQPKVPLTRKHTNSHELDVEETHKHVPSGRLQDCHLAESLHLNCNVTTQDREMRLKEEFSLEEEDDLSVASAKSPHVFEFTGNAASESKRCSTNSAGAFEARTHMQDMPLNSLNTSQQSCPLSDGYNFFHSSGKYQEEACTSSGLRCENEGNRYTTCNRERATEWSDKGPRHPQDSSANFSKFSTSMKMQQIFSTEAKSNAGLFENGLDSVTEKAQTKEKNLFASVKSNAESKTRPQAVKSIPFLPLRSKHPVSRESACQGGKRLLCKDVESFLLKVQKAKQRGRELLSNSHAANFVEGSLCDNDNERDDSSDDDRFIFPGHEHLEDGAAVKLKDFASKSTAAQEHAKNQAIRYLAMRPYTASQLRKKLESQNITSELADYALTVVQKCGLQSDLLYAETFSRARFNHSSWGPQRIKLGLKQRGVSNEIIEAAIASVFREEENDSEQYGRFENNANSNLAKMSGAAMDHLLLQATKQWNRGRNATNETKVRRMVSWLQYRGFNYDVIKTVLQHLQKGIHIEGE